MILCCNSWSRNIGFRIFGNIEKYKNLKNRRRGSLGAYEYIKDRLLPNVLILRTIYIQPSWILDSIQRIEFRERVETKNFKISTSQVDLIYL